MSPGDKRRRQAKRERDRAAYDLLMEPLRASGAVCGTCQNYKVAPYDRAKHICEIDSDHDGYTVVKAGGLCPHWASK